MSSCRSSAIPWSSTCAALSFETFGIVDLLLVDVDRGSGGLLFDLGERFAQVGRKGPASPDVVQGLRDPAAHSASELALEHSLDAGAAIYRDHRELPRAIGGQDV